MPNRSSRPRALIVLRARRRPSRGHMIPSALLIVVRTPVWTTLLVARRTKPESECWGVLCFDAMGDGVDW